MNELSETKFGFRWGPLTVERLVSDERFGYVVCVRGAQEATEIRVAPKGRMMSVTKRLLYDHEREAKGAVPS